MGTMTVRENLEFSAALRLPKDFTKKDREKRVNSIIQDLGLFRCADTRVSLFVASKHSGTSLKWTFSSKHWIKWKSDSSDSNQ